MATTTARAPRRIMSPHEYGAMGEEFEGLEHRVFGEDWVMRHEARTDWSMLFGSLYLLIVAGLAAVGLRAVGFDDLAVRFGRGMAVALGRGIATRWASVAGFLPPLPR